MAFSIFKKKPKYTQFEKGSRVYESESDAKEFAKQIERERGYKAVVYQTTQKEWAVLY